MSTPEQLRRAIETARAGQKQEARDLLLKIVEEDPHIEIAWIWLSGLVDSLEDRIIACENVLTINPGNEKVRAYLQQLQEEQQAELQRSQLSESQELIRRAKACADAEDVVSALRLAEQATQRNPNSEDAWLLIAGLSTQMSDRLSALERAHTINPSNSKTLGLLEQARRVHDDPIGAAAHYEQTGQLDKALDLYNQLAAKTKDSREFDHIYSNILRLERLKEEKIQYVPPRTSILRLAFGWPLLYFFLVMVQVGLNPFRHFAFHLWLGLPIVGLGSFLLSLSEVRTRHRLWKTLFAESGDGSSFARLVTATAGWMFVIFPHLLLLIDSLNRLLNFRIPPEPF